MSIARKPADTSVDIHPVLSERWSPRAFQADVKMGTEDLTAILEAGRWAPSAMNGQPWRCTFPPAAFRIGIAHPLRGIL